MHDALFVPDITVTPVHKFYLTYDERTEDFLSISL